MHPVKKSQPIISMSNSDFLLLDYIQQKVRMPPIVIIQIVGVNPLSRRPLIGKLRYGKPMTSSDDVTAPPDDINVPRWVCQDPQRRAVMLENTRVGLDLAKNVLIAFGASSDQAHGADASRRAVLRKKLRRDQVPAFFSQLQPCFVAMESIGGAHFWGREIGKIGHDVRLIPPAYVKPFVKRQMNDAADAEAICEAAQRPTMRFVP